MSTFKTCIKNVTIIPVAALAVWLFVFATAGAWGEDGYIPSGTRIETSPCYLSQDLFRSGLIASDDGISSVATILVPAFTPLFPSRKIVPWTCTAFLMEKSSESTIDSHNYLITQPVNVSGESAQSSNLIENLVQHIFTNGKTPFPFNKILLFKNARLFKSYYNIYIHIYTNFDDIETLESIKNIGTLIPRVNLTVRTGI